MSSPHEQPQDDELADDVGMHDTARPAADDETLDAEPRELAVETVGAVDLPCAGAVETLLHAESNTDDPPNRTRLGSKVRYFGDYELLEEIAHGGMGVVYKARQISLNRIVALKMILAGQLASQQEVQRFHTEAEAAAKLDHPGIVPIHEVGQHEGQHYFSMGFVEGQSLADKLADGPLPPEEAADLVKKLAEAMAYAHDHGVIHRDLKPANVLLDQQGQPRITDFGLAKKLEADSQLTGTGQILGTPSYMPPEQASGRVHQVNETADVYSMGAVLYALLTGRPPFQAGNPMDTLLEVLNKQPVGPRQTISAIPRDLETICLKCLEKTTHARYQSASELAAELERFLKGEAIQARPIGAAVRGWRWCKRNPVMAGLTGAVAILLAALAVALVRIPSNANPSADRSGERRSLIGPSKQPPAKERLVVVGDDSTAPPLAKAPFNAEQARQHQQAWSEYLGAPVEWEIDLPGGEKVTLVLVPPGEFLMGSSLEEQDHFLEDIRRAGETAGTAKLADEGPQHRVTITQPFFLGKYEVTQAQWEAVLAFNPSRFKNPTNPVEQASWNYVQSFLKKLNQANRWQDVSFVLPDEAQWEYACRAGTITPYYFGDNKAIRGDYAWVGNNSGRIPNPVGKKKPNAWGLYDMYGNVAEWCEDWYDPEYYTRSPTNDPLGPRAGLRRVIRGAGFSATPCVCRSASRGHATPDTMFGNLGCRLAAVIVDKSRRAD